MNLNQLIYIYSIVKYDTIRETADRLYVTQPAISQQIKSLENELGFSIFEKVGRNIRLTKEGEQLYPEIESLVTTFRQLESQIHEVQNPSKGRLRLGIGPIIANQIFPDIFRSFHERFPSISITNQQGGSVELKELLINDKLDLIVTSVTDQSIEFLDEHNIKEERLQEFNFIAIVSEDHRFSSNNSIFFHDLAKEQLIVPHNSIMKKVILSMFGDEFEDKIIFSSDNNETNRQLIKLGSSVALLPEPYVNLWSEKEREKLHFLKLNNFETRLFASCLYKNRTNLPEYKKFIIDIIKNSVESKEFIASIQKKTF